jgi:8-oxo-dGTP diphosphatase
MLKYHKKWGKVYNAPGGKMESGETPLECVKREFKEETGLELINPTLKGLAYWKDSSEGIVFIFVANDYQGILDDDNIEGKSEWIGISEMNNLIQFPMNKEFVPYLFKDKLFEGKFLLNDDTSIISYSIREI